MRSPQLGRTTDIDVPKLRVVSSNGPVIRRSADPGFQLTSPRPSLTCPCQDGCHLKLQSASHLVADERRSSLLPSFIMPVLVNSMM